MSKPEWKDAPKGMQWMAQDADGEWFWWKAKPRISSDPFWVPSKYPATYSRAKCCEPNPNWKETLERRS